MTGASNSGAPADLDPRFHDWRTLIEQLPLAVYIDRLDEWSSNLYTSPQIEPILGYSVEEWTGDDHLLLKILHPDDRDRVMAAHRRSCETGEPFRMEYRMIARDGRVVWFLDQATAIPGPSGQAGFHHGFLLDITERKALEAQLAEQTNREREYIEQAGHVVAAATAVENRSFDPESLDHVALRDDALGQLARVFRRMAREHAVARSLAETADPHDALARALAAIGESLGWRWGAMWAPAPDRPQALRCVETWSAVGSDARDLDAASRSLALAAGEGLPGRVWRSGEPAWIADVLADANFPRTASARRAGLRAAFCFPIRSGRGVLGVIELFTGEPRRLDAELLATMSALGDLIAQAVERRRDAEALGAKEARHRAMLDAALDCVVTMDHEGRVLDFNPAAERTFGYRAGDAIGREMAELIVPPELRDRHRRGLARYLATGEAVVLERRLEITGMRADGTTFPLELAITRIDPSGPPTFTGYLRDITERKAAEAELRESRARIVAAADAARRRLERDLHDGAQQRLTTVGLILRAAQGQLDGAANPAVADALSQAVDELKAGLAELRALARGLHPAILTDQGLVPALEALTGRAASPVRLRAEPIGRLPGAVEAAAYFVVSEALTNVAKHAAAAAAQVTVSRHDGKLLVEVADEGPGGATLDAGSGLRGLSDRVAAVDGRLALDSPPRGGTRISCELPCA